MSQHTGVYDKNTPPRKKTSRNIGFRSTKSGAGQQFLLRDCKARAHPKGVFISQTPVCRELLLCRSPVPLNCFNMCWSLALRCTIWNSTQHHSTHGKTRHTQIWAQGDCRQIDSCICLHYHVPCIMLAYAYKLQSCFETPDSTSQRHAWAAFCLIQGGTADTGVCEKNTPQDKRILRKIGFQSTKSGPISADPIRPFPTNSS